MVLLSFLLPCTMFALCGDDKNEPSQNQEPIYQAVDLGLSVKWCNMNVNAKSITDYGTYFSWGELYGKTSYAKNAYQHYDSATDAPIHIGDNISGSKYDVAHIVMGGNWRMPTMEECEELLAKCTVKTATVNGQSVIEITGPNGNHIYLPKGGYKTRKGIQNEGASYIWSATLSTVPDEHFKNDYDAHEWNAFSVSFSDTYYFRNCFARIYGLAVRAVQ